MGRVSLVSEASRPDLAAPIAAMTARRGGKLINVYRTLLNAPELAFPWGEHLDAVRWKTGLDPALRELVILRIAILNGADYVVKRHASTYAMQDGLGHEQCAALSDWQASPLFDDCQKAVLTYVDAMTLRIGVSDEEFAPLRYHFDDRGLVELTVLIGTYNMQTRVIRALEIDYD